MSLQMLIDLGWSFGPCANWTDGELPKGGIGQTGPQSLSVTHRNTKIHVRILQSSTYIFSKYTLYISICRKKTHTHMILALFFSKLPAVGFSCHSSIPQIPEQRGGPLQYEGILPQILIVYLISWYSNRFPNIFSLGHRTSALVKTGSAVRRPVKLWRSDAVGQVTLLCPKGFPSFAPVGEETQILSRGPKYTFGTQTNYLILLVSGRVFGIAAIAVCEGSHHWIQEPVQLWTCIPSSKWRTSYLELRSGYIPDMPEFYLWTNLKTYSHWPLRILDPTSGVAVGSQGLFSHWVDGKERSRQVGRIWRRSTCSSRAPWLGFKFSITDARRTSQVFKPFTLW